MTCPSCGRPAPDGARFCSTCGGSLDRPEPFAGTRPTDFHVVGDVMQAVVVPLASGQQMQAEPGALLYMAGDVEMDSTMRGGFWGGIKRIVAGESLFMTRFRARGEGQAAFAAPHPGKVRRVELLPGEVWLCQRDSFLCATDGVEVGIAFTKRFGAGLFGGEGFILERLSGEGTVFIHGGGNFLEFDLLPGQTLRVDTGCIVAFQEGVRYDIQFVGGFKNALFGGEGLFLATLTGPGQVVLQTLPFSRLAGRILGTTNEGTGGLAGVGGTLRDLGNIFGRNE
jgi:uncharacterized protein (TIGR00266 family)